MMTSKERVRATLNKQKPDRVAATYGAVAEVTQNLLAHYGFENIEQLYQKFEIDVRGAGPRYIGPELEVSYDENGLKVETSYWGFKKTMHKTDIGTYGTTTYFPLENVETLEDLDKYNYPDPDWFDYSAITETCEKFPDKAIIIGHPGPFQMVTNLMSMDKFFILMLDEPEVAKAILDRMVDFEMEYYRRCFEAGKGKIDILRTCDDYGTQISMLFSLDMWKDFFKENTKRLVNLTHEYDAFFMQHSCGAIAPIIPELIDCKVDILDPIQKVSGLEIDTINKLYKGQIVFHGGVDTQWLLPSGTPEEVKKETQYIIDTLGADGGYMLMASQAFEIDVPIENIEAVYSAKR